MRKIILSISVLWCGWNFASAQSVERSVVAGAGAVAINSGGQYTWTLGESVVQLATGGSVILSQGFQQPESSAVNVKSISSANGLKVYPNPSSGFFTMESAGSNKNENLAFLVFDNAGKQVFSGTSGNVAKYTMDLSSLPGGIYLLQVASVGGSVQNFKLTIIK